MAPIIAETPSGCVISDGIATAADGTQTIQFFGPGDPAFSGASDDSRPVTSTSITDGRFATISSDKGDEGSRNKIKSVAWPTSNICPGPLGSSSTDGGSPTVQ